jgi:shikimate dehydrogenase
MPPLICASLTHASPEAMVEASTSTRADLVEARLDGLDHLDAGVVRRLGDGLHRPAVATLRPVERGGGYEGAPPDRAGLLKTALEAGFVLVDVEEEAPFRDDLLDAARGAPGDVLVSRHVFGSPPTVEAIVDMARRAREDGAWGAKLAAEIQDAEDAATLTRAARQAASDGLRLAVMGVGDPVLRLVAPGLDAPLTYASHEGGEAAAPGQVPADLLRVVHDSFHDPTPTGSTAPAFLLGSPVEHSLSPAMQTAAFRATDIDAVYLASDVDEADLGAAVDALPALGAVGANVTAPHKAAVLDHVDGVTPTVETAGCANTLVVEDGDVLAHNTDGAGALEALRRNGVAVEGARCLALGAGDAARSVAHALQGPARSIHVANRTYERGKALAARVGGAAVHLEEASELLADVDILLDCTPVGRHGDEALVDRTALHEDLAVFDAVYRPGYTPLIQAARVLGATAVPGEEMLLHQGAESFRIWTNREPPLMVMRRAVEDQLEVRAWRAGP